MWYWEQSMNAPVEVIGETETVTITIEGKSKSVPVAFIFPNEWDALEWQQKVADQSLFRFGAQVFWAETPQAIPKQCRYGGPDMKGTGKHILVCVSHVFSALPNQIYGVYATPKDIA